MGELEKTEWPFNMSRDQWRKWVACEATKGMLTSGEWGYSNFKGSVETAYAIADAFLKEGDGDE